mgnify:FL=1
MRELALGLSLAAAANLGLGRLTPPPSADPYGVKAGSEGAVETAALFGLGMRRMAADLALIRMIIYYGTPEDDGHGHQGPHEHHGHSEFDAEHPERSYGGGSYGKLGGMAMRILDLDPAFAFAPLFAAGALAFNLNRPEEAVEVLRYAIRRDPGQTQYQAYLGAIGFHRKGKPEEVARLLEPLVAYNPDCPTLIKNMLAFLYKRTGQYQKAIALYLDIYETSRDQGYRRMAERELRELAKAPPAAPKSKRVRPAR